MASNPSLCLATSGKMVRWKQLSLADFTLEVIDGILMLFEINLAPLHKQGLIVSSPVLLAGRSIGYSEAFHSGVQPQKLGAVGCGRSCHAS